MPGEPPALAAPLSSLRHTHCPERSLQALFFFSDLDYLAPRMVSVDTFEIFAKACEYMLLDSG